MVYSLDRVCRGLLLPVLKQGSAVLNESDVAHAGDQGEVEEEVSVMLSIEILAQ